MIVVATSAQSVRAGPIRSRTRQVSAQLPRLIPPSRSPGGRCKGSGTD